MLVNFILVIISAGGRSSDNINTIGINTYNINPDVAIIVIPLRRANNI